MKNQGLWKGWKELHSLGALSRWSFHIGQTVAQAGDTQAMQWLLEHGGHWDGRFLLTAIAEGHVAFLQWALGWNCSFHEDLCEAAARAGQLHVLQWLRQKGWPWDASTCSAAAESGHLELLQWVRAQGCPWDWRTLASAAQNHWSDVCAWVVSQGGLGALPSNLGEILIEADQVPLLVWALKQGLDPKGLEQTYSSCSEPTFYQQRQELRLRYGFSCNRHVGRWMVAVDKIVNVSVLPPLLPSDLRRLVLSFC